MNSNWEKVKVYPISWTRVEGELLTFLISKMTLVLILIYLLIIFLCVMQKYINGKQITIAIRIEITIFFLIMWFLCNCFPIVKPMNEIIGIYDRARMVSSPSTEATYQPSNVVLQRCRSNCIKDANAHAR